MQSVVKIFAAFIENYVCITDGTDKNSSEFVVDEELIHGELSKSIIGAAMTVLNVLKPGLDEKLYENALVIELRKRGHRVEQQT